MADRYDSDKGKGLSRYNIRKIPKRQTAVALSDADGKRGAPIITAAGRGKIAETILQLALENDIKVREDSALVEILATIELDSPIPSEAFGAVAEILSYIYRANGQPNPFDVVLRDAMGEDEKDTPDHE